MAKLPIKEIRTEILLSNNEVSLATTDLLLLVHKLEDSPVKDSSLVAELSRIHKKLSTARDSFSELYESL